MASAYRDETHPLREELRTLEQRLSESKAETLRLSALQRDEAALEAEVAALRRRVFAHETRRTMPMLDNLRIASPCKVDWDTMAGDERVRYCGQCAKNVYNVAGMTRDEAKKLLEDRSGKLCLRIYRRADGTVLTSDCPVGAKRKRRLAIFGAAAGAATAFGGLVATTTMGGAMMGDVHVMGELEGMGAPYQAAEPEKFELPGPFGGVSGMDAVDRIGVEPAPDARAQASEE
jgi:hypothetical protein